MWILKIKFKAIPCTERQTDGQTQVKLLPTRIGRWKNNCVSFFSMQWQTVKTAWHVTLLGGDIKREIMRWSLRKFSINVQVHNLCDISKWSFDDVFKLLNWKQFFQVTCAEYANLLCLFLLKKCWRCGSLASENYKSKCHVTLTLEMFLSMKFSLIHHNII